MAASSLTADPASLKQHALDLKGAARESSMREFSRFIDGDGSAALRRLDAPLTCGASVRVVCVL